MSEAYPNAEYLEGILYFDWPGINGEADGAGCGRSAEGDGDVTCVT